LRSTQAGQRSGGSLPERQADPRLVSGVPEGSATHHPDRRTVAGGGGAAGNPANECHNPVTGLSAPLRILCRLTSGNREPRRPAAAELVASRGPGGTGPGPASRVVERSGRLVLELGDDLRECGPEVGPFGGGEGGGGVLLQRGAGLAVRVARRPAAGVRYRRTSRASAGSGLRATRPASSIRVAVLTMVGVAAPRRRAISPGASPSWSQSALSTMCWPTRTPCPLMASSAASRSSLAAWVNRARRSSIPSP